MVFSRYCEIVRNLLEQLGFIDIARDIYHCVEDIFYHDLLVQNKILKNIHAEERCFILGTGVSLNFFDLQVLSNENIFGCNFIFIHKDFNNIKLQYYFEIDPYSSLMSVASRAKYVHNIIHSEKDIESYQSLYKHLFPFSVLPSKYFAQIDNTLLNTTRLFFHTSNRPFIEKQQFFKNKHVYFIQGSRPLLSAKEQVIDLSKRITFSEGSIFAMLAAAMFMGFKEIYLMGVDYSLTPSLQFHFYDSPIFSKGLSKSTVERLICKVASERSVEVFSIDEDASYYIPLYVQTNSTYDKHRTVKEMADSIGVKIWNVTPDRFESPVYEKVTWEHVKNKVLNSDN
jgi:hypothetical protein